MPELFLQILLVGAVAAAVKAMAFLSVKRGFSPLPAVLLLGLILGPTVFNLFGAPLFTAGVGLSENTNATGLMKVLIELGLIQLVFVAGALTDFEKLKKHLDFSILSGSAIFLFAAGFSILVLKVFAASWSLALAMASVVSVGSAAALTAAKNKPGDTEQSAIAQGTSLTTFVLGAGLLFAATGLRFEPTYGAAMTVIGILYFFLKAVLLVGAAFVAGRLYLKKIAGRESAALRVQGVVGFVLLFALFYGWAAWSVGQIAALPVAFMFGGLFARSNFEIKGKALAGLSKPDSWLISVFFLAFGLTADFFALEGQIGFFLWLLAAALAGKISGATVAAKITGKTSGEGLKLAARTFPIGETGLILAFFAHSRGGLVPEVFPVAAAIIALTTFAGPFLLRPEQSLIKKQDPANSPKRSKNRSRRTILRKAVQ
jgi:CPA2 family monovalent cation:H+ antiporter-2